MKIYNLKENVKLHIYKTSQFKDVNVYIEMLDNSNEKDQLTRLLLSMCLEESCSLYNNKQAVSNLFSKLYGATFSIFPDVKGKARIFEVKTNFINGKYVDDNNLINKQFEVIKEFLFNPIFKNEQYPLKTFNEIKDRVKLFLLNEEDNPNLYANKAIDKICGNYISLKTDYDVKDVDSIKIEDIINMYNKLINETCVDIFVVGDVDEEQVYKLCLENFYFKDRKVDKQLVYKANLDNKEVIEERKIKQSILKLVYKTNNNILDENFASMIIANGILGSLPTSLLFQEIREKRSLCYSISSSLYGYDGILKISTGINYKNIEIVKQLINEQILKIKKGDFTNELLDTTKTMYINLYRQSSDNIKAIIWDEYKNEIIKSSKNNEEMIKELSKVTKESVMEIFKNVELKVCFILKQLEK